MQINISYIATIPAILKTIEIIIDIICLICVGVTPNYSYGAGGWLIFVAVITLIVTVMVYMLHLTNLIIKIPGPVTLMEFISILMCAILHLISLIVASATSFNISSAIAAAVFFSLNFICYGIDAFFLFALYRVNGGYLINGPRGDSTPQFPPTVMTVQPTNADNTVGPPNSQVPNGSSVPVGKPYEGRESAYAADNAVYY